MFVINHTFEAPTDVLFDMWTDPRHLPRWLPPAGSTMHFMKSDISVGGSSLYAMSRGGATTMYGRADYLEIDHPHRLVYTQQFCDEHGQVARHPLDPAWPETLRTTVLLAAESPCRTRVTVRWEVHGTATRTEAEAFNSAKGNMTVGWTGSFDKLEAYLSGER